MKIICKVLILLVKNSSIYSLPFLRRFRWGLYRYYFDVKKLYVDERVTIVKAHTNPSSQFFSGERVHIGKDVYIDYSGGIEVAGDMSISEGVKIYTHNHEVNGKYKDWKLNGIVFSSLRIEKRSWIGANAIILPNVKVISEGSVVAAGSVLTKDTEPYCIYAGNPAKKISERIIDNEK